MRKEIRNGKSTKHPEPVSPFESSCYPCACQLERDFLADSMTRYGLGTHPLVWSWRSGRVEPRLRSAMSMSDQHLVMRTKFEIAFRSTEGVLYTQAIRERSKKGSNKEVHRNLDMEKGKHNHTYEKKETRTGRERQEKDGDKGSRKVREIYFLLFV